MGDKYSVSFPSQLQVKNGCKIMFKLLHVLLRPSEHSGGMGYCPDKQCPEIGASGKILEQDLSGRSVVSSRCNGREEAEPFMYILSNKLLCPR